jgi:excinuclease ABC subunit B
VLLERLVDNLAERNDYDLKRGRFRVRGDVIDIMPAYSEQGLRVELWGDEVEAIAEFDPLTGAVTRRLEQFDLYPANQYVTSKGKLEGAVAAIRKELDARVAEFESQGKYLEAQRVRMRTNYDLEMLQEMGFCNGIENYSMHLAGRSPGSRPFCLIDFFPPDFLLMIDESHVTLPQIGGMFNGDRARKQVLVDFGFRLPSALENRPQSFEEFRRITGQTVFVSATPAPLELGWSTVVAEQVIRPTGLLDPEISVRPTKGQVEDLIGEARKAVVAGERVLVTTLTKRLSEDLTSFMREAGLRVEYLHSDIDAIERVEILRNLRLGHFDILIGINLLREGLDLPEVALVAILDADKEGFLRSETSLIQTAGRAARHEAGRVIFYADVMTQSIRRTIEVTGRRRAKQMEYNREHGIVPRSVKRAAQASLGQAPGADESEGETVAAETGAEDVAAVIAELEADMTEAAGRLEFERAALLRDQIDALRGPPRGRPTAAVGGAADGPSFRCRVPGALTAAVGRIVASGRRRGVVRAPNRGNGLRAPWRLRPLRRVLVLGLEHPDARQVAVAFREIEPVAHDEGVGNGEADEVGLERHLAPPALVEQHAHLDAGGILLADQVHDERQGLAGVEDVVDQEDVAVGKIEREILQELGSRVRARRVAVT